jgi:anti-sigma factor RsiW
MRKRPPTDQELIRYLEGDVTNSHAGRIVLLTSANSAHQKRLDALEQTFELLSQPHHELVEVDLLPAIHRELQRAPEPKPKSRLLAVFALAASLLVLSLPATIIRRALDQETAEHQKVERRILGWLSLEPEPKPELKPPPSDP